MATVSVSMATRSSDLDDQKSGVHIQTKGHTLTPPSQVAGMILKRQGHLVAPPINHPSLLWGNQHLTALKLNIV